MSSNPIVVGVDGSDSNRSAVLWAAGEASRSFVDKHALAALDISREVISLP